MNIGEILIQLLPTLLPILLECFDKMDEKQKVAFIRFAGTPGGSKALAELGINAYGTDDNGELNQQMQQALQQIQQAT